MQLSTVVRPNGRLSGRAGLISLASVLALSPAAFAANVYWDRNGATAGAGGTSNNGTWDATSTGNWSTSPDGTAATAAYSVANGGSPGSADVFFSAGTDSTGSSAITIAALSNTGVIARGITIQEGAITTAITGTFSAGPVLTLGAGGLTLASTAAGTSSFSSTTTVGLADSQTWTNNISTLFTAGGDISSVATSGTQTLTLSSPGSGGFTLSKIISDGSTGGKTAMLVDSASGAITLSGANTFTGGVTLNSGSLVLTNATALGGSASTLTVNGGVVRSSAALVMTANNAQAWNGDFGFGSASTLNMGTGAVTLGGTGTDRVVSVGAGSGRVTIGGAVTGSKNLTLNALVTNSTGFQFTGGIATTGNLVLNMNSSGGISFITNSVNNAGTITNSGTGTGNNAIETVGSNVTAITQDSVTSGLVLTSVNVNASGTTLSKSNVTGSKTLSFTSGGSITGVGNLIISNNSSQQDGVNLNNFAPSINNAGTITNSGTGALVAVAGTIGSNVTGIIQNSATSGLNLGGALTVNASGTSLTNNTASGSATLLYAGAISGSGNLVLANNGAITNGITLSNTVVAGGINNAGTITNSGTGNGNTLISGSIKTAVTGVVQNSSTSALVLTGANTFTSGVSVLNGLLKADANAALGTGTAVIDGGTLEVAATRAVINPITLTSGTLTVNGSTSTGALTLTAGTIKGTGTIGQAVLVGSGVIVAPGNSVGTLNTGAETWSGGGSYNWQIVNADVTGVAGAAYDTISATSLNLASLSVGNQFNLNLWSLSASGPDVNGFAANWDNTVAHTWTLLSTGSAIDPSKLPFININVAAAGGTSGFTNATGGGSFSLDLADGNTDLVLKFTPVPEPGSVAMFGIGLACLFGGRRRAGRSSLDA